MVDLETVLHTNSISLVYVNSFALVSKSFVPS